MADNSININKMEYIKRLRPYIGHKKIILNCSGGIVVKDNKILLQRRKDNGKWGFVGGLVELDETYEEAALREVKEETGLIVKPLYMLGIFHNHNMKWANGDKAHTFGAYYVFEIVGGELTLDEESYELKFFDPDKAPRLFSEDHRLALEAYKKGIKLPLLDENKKG